MLSPKFTSRTRSLKSFFTPLLVIMFTTTSRAFIARSSMTAFLSGSFFSAHNVRCDANGSKLHMSTVSSPVTNPLLDKSKLPKFDSIKSEHVLPAVQSDLKELKTNFEGIWTI
jgi:hypothetical protein